MAPVVADEAAVESAGASFEVRRRVRVTASDARSRRRRAYTREDIIDAVRDWVERYGDPPMLADWDPSRARRVGQAWRATRFEQDTWPTVRMVCAEFGRFGDAVLEAGFEPLRRGSTKPRLADGPTEILRAIRAWTMRYGEPPVQADWEPARARQLGQGWRVARYEQGDWPSLASVRHHFGTLTAAACAVDLEPGQANQSAAVRLARRERNRRAVAEHLGHTAPASAKQIAGCVRKVAAARSAGDDEVLGVALVELAGAALGWADRLTGVGAPEPAAGRRALAPVHDVEKRSQPAT